MYTRRFLKKSFWEKGSATVLTFMASVIVILAACMLVLDYCSVYMDAENAQLVADLEADGGAVAGDTKWGINKSKVTEVTKKLTNANASLLKNRDTTLSSSVKVNTKTGQVSVTSKTKKDSTYKVGAVSATANASSKVLYSGGRAIVMYAYKFSQNYYNYLKSHGMSDTRGYSGYKWTRYVWAAGRSWDACNMPWYADCSGFVYSVFAKFGYYIGTWTGEMQNVGTVVSQSEARAGDIILYYSSGDSISSHVGIYVGEKNGVPMQIDCGGGGPETSIYNTPSSSGVKLRSVSAAAGGRRPEYRRIIKSSGKAYDVPKTNNLQTIVYIFAEAGYSDAAIAGILGNWGWESGLCAITVQNHFGKYNDSFNIAYANRIKSGQMTREAFVADTTGGGGYGLAQWTYPTRKLGLWNCCKRLGVDVTSEFGQVMYALEEINSGAYGAIQSPAFKNMTDPKQAAYIFFMCFEGAGDDSGPSRMALAENYYRQIKNM